MLPQQVMQWRRYDGQTNIPLLAKIRYLHEGHYIPVKILFPARSNQCLGSFGGIFIRQCRFTSICMNMIQTIT